MKRIVFICTGNTCRSPMAHAIFTRLINSNSIEPGEYEVLSAGLNTINGLPASPEAVETMANAGIDLSSHQSRQVDDSLILMADYVLTMTAAQRDYLQDKYPDKVSSIYTISEFAGESGTDIVDPIGKGLDAYQACAWQLKQLLPRVVYSLSELETITIEEKTKVVAIGSDHAGFELKSEIIKVLEADQYKILDCGTFSSQSVDYPDIAEEVAKTVMKHRIKGIIICGTGIGISIAANKIPGIRAALCYNLESAGLARKHNNANIVAVGARMLEQQLVVDIVKTFLTTEFEAGRHQRRVEKISALERNSEGANKVDYIEKYVKPVDPVVAKAIRNEELRQNHKLELIASENFVSRAVMAAQGGVMTNKYAEGYPGKRYYGGCENVDVVEELARERAKKLFNCEHVNVQPHSGAQANTAVYFAVVQPGDSILGMNLSHGGHLTHGSRVNISGKYFNFSEYGVNPETETIDYEEVRKIARKAQPKLIVAGASAYPRIIDFKKFREIADEVGALLFVDMAHIAGLVAAGLHPSPVPYADFVTTTTHKTLRGPRGGMIMCKKEWAKKIDSAVFPGIQGGPLMHVIAAKAVCLGEALQEEFTSYQKQVVLNAQALAASLVENGLRLVSGGTDNHLILVDVRPKKLNGQKAEAILESINITVNKNGIPFDPEKPTITSGIRIGTPALTSRGMNSQDMREIGDIIATALSNSGDDHVLTEAREKVAKICDNYPIYEI